MLEMLYDDRVVRGILLFSDLCILFYYIRLSENFSFILVY